MSGRDLPLCVTLLLILHLPVLVLGIYTCSITGDPHLITFAGESASLAIPCAYLVTRMELPNNLVIPGLTYYPKIVVEVVAGNSQDPINGRYYVSDLQVQVTFNGSTAESPTNTFYIGEHVLTNHSGWDMLSTEMLQDRVQHTYNASTDIATLQIVNTSLRIQFRPPVRTEGNHQTRRPGIIVEIGEASVISSKDLLFPDSMCSTVNDTTSIKEHEEFHGLQHKFMGLFAVLAHMQYNIPTGDQDNQCPSLMGKFRICDDKFKKQAFLQCFGLMRTPEVVNCFETQFNNTPVTFATDACLDFHCTENNAGCLKLQNYTRTCSRVGAIVNLTACA